MIGCKVGILLSIYLGLPLGAPFKSVATWDGEEERTRRRLTMWMRLYICKGERITLIRTMMASLPIFFMSLLSIPRLVRMQIE